MKKMALLLVALLVVPMLLTACDTESQDAAKDYLDAMFEGNIEDAENYVCDEFEVDIEGYQSTADLYNDLPFLVEGTEVRNVNLKYDVGKGNNHEEVIVTGSYEIVELNQAGRMIPDSEEEYELAASVRDRRDFDGDGDDTESFDTRILLEMSDEDDWCVESIERGFWEPKYSEEAEEDENAADDESEEADES